MIVRTLCRTVIGGRKLEAGETIDIPAAEAGRLAAYDIVRPVETTDERPKRRRGRPKKRFDETADTQAKFEDDVEIK